MFLQIHCSLQGLLSGKPTDLPLKLSCIVTKRKLMDFLYLVTFKKRTNSFTITTSFVQFSHEANSMIMMKNVGSIRSKISEIKFRFYIFDKQYILCHSKPDIFSVFSWYNFV